ncbi:hypothetical protein [Nocardia sp. XZ_19_231]|uniref:hypothetical protein n=1 Tax=Nocardia sp. XZ_19_231 TaxID=2769252 RepID=UPI00188FEDD0|nr:hypothetical protein [Nocardia sp. XZ_19_231]
MTPSRSDAARRLAVAAAMVFQVSAHARAGLRTTAESFEAQARLLLADGEAEHRDSVRDAYARAEELVATADVEMARRQRDSEVDGADRRRHSLIAAIARHRLDEDARNRRRAAAIDKQERAAQRMLIEANRGDLCAYRPTVTSPAGVTVDELVAAQELGVHELRRRLDVYLAAVETHPEDDRYVADL